MSYLISPIREIKIDHKNNMKPPIFCKNGKILKTGNQNMNYIAKTLLSPKS